MNIAQLIIIWESGEREVYDYQTIEDAEKGMYNFKMAFGNQISWCGILKKR